MSQISPPIRILLVCAVAFMAAWTTVLKPKPVTAEPDATATTQASTAQSAAGQFAQRAEAAKATAEAPAAKAAGEGEGRSSRYERGDARRDERRAPCRGRGGEAGRAGRPPRPCPHRARR